MVPPSIYYLGWFHQVYNLEWFHQVYNLEWFHKVYNLGWLHHVYNLGWFHQVYNEKDALSINHNWLNAANINFILTILNQQLARKEQLLMFDGC